MSLPFLLKRAKQSKLQASIFIIFLLLLFSCLLLVVRVARAQVPPGTQECDDTAFPEFQTFRPYQADPCNRDYQDLAMFCGNDLVISQTLTVTRYNSNYLLYCTNISPYMERCYYQIPNINLDLAIDVSGAEFPIMGNTEGIDNNVGIINSVDQSTPEQIDDAEKVNEYVSWYLNGVSNPAEYGALDPDDPDDLFKIINLSGPIKKLLPHRKQRDLIEEAIDSVATETQRHDQVVGCVWRFTPLTPLLNPPWRWGRITPCYPESVWKDEVRISDFNPTRRRPPPEEGFPTVAAWWMRYQEWRGYRCMRIIGNIEVCINDPTSPDYWGNLFFKIPLGATEDRMGLVEVINPTVQPASPGMTITVNDLDTSPADLFFAHQEESRKLADILQSTYTPQGQAKFGPVSQVSPAEYCDLTQVRSNPGDDLFAGEIGVSVDYTADFSCLYPIVSPPELPERFWCNVVLQGECVTDQYTCDMYFEGAGCPTGYRCGRDCTFNRPNYPCSVTAQVILNTITETPLTDEIWSRLVAGAMGVFKRIFPKVGPGAPIEGILDIPGATGVNFSLVNPPAGVWLYAGNPSNQRSQLELYFPHVGGIHEYFLKCIQQALRPEGFGEGCLSGAPPSAALCSPGGDIPDLPGAGGSCGLSSGGPLGVPSELARAISAAATTFNVPPSLILGVMFGEGAFESGRYDWTNDNVEEWLREGACMPNCNPAVFPSQGVVPFLTQAIWNEHADAVRQIDPNRVPNPCNLLDLIFAMADFLRDGAAGNPGFAGYSCFGFPLNTGVAPLASCSWPGRDVETAIKVWESGYTTAVGSRCWTGRGTCLLGEAGQACTLGNGDGCETITNRYAWPDTSHTGCVWNVYQQY